MREINLATPLGKVEQEMSDKTRNEWQSTFGKGGAKGGAKGIIWV